MAALVDASLDVVLGILGLTTTGAVNKKRARLRTELGLTNFAGNDFWASYVDTGEEEGEPVKE